MKIHVATIQPVKSAIETVIGLLIENFSAHPEAKTADVVVVSDKGELEKVYTKHQRFIVLSLENPGYLPENAQGIDKLDVAKLLKYLEELRKNFVEPAKIEKPVEEVKTPPTEVSPQATRLKILVVDDKIDNLTSAVALLGNTHAVSIAGSYGEALRLITVNTYDAVLCDCQMPISSADRTALSMEAIRVGQEVPCGPYLIFPATMRGARVAIVTDANHHRDWTSALFDGLREPQIVNGQKVLFINYLGKDWARALESLMDYPPSPEKQERTPDGRKIFR